MTPIPDPTEVRTIAVRLTNWVGDAVMNTPFLARVRELFPNARVYTLGRKNVAALFDGHPGVDEVWEIDDKSWKGFRQAASRLRGLRPDLGFILPNSMKSAALFAAGGVKNRVGYSRDARKALLTHPVAPRPEDLAVHEVKYYLRLLHFWETELREPPPLKLVVADEERARIDTWLEGHGVGRNDFVVGVNPSAFFGTAKRWLPESYAAVASHFVRNRAAHVVVTGLPSERGTAEEVCRFGSGRFHNAAGEMNLRDLVAFLARCDLFLTNDSGAMHIAAALGTPLAAIFGSTDWVTTAPYSPAARIVRVETPCAPCILRHCPIDHRCMTGVTADMVIASAEGMLAEVDR